jgi:hypothetical protein
VRGVATIDDRSVPKYKNDVSFDRIFGVSKVDFVSKNQTSTALLYISILGSTHGADLSIPHLEVHRY